MTDQELVHRLLDGDAGAQEMLVERYALPIYGLVHTIMAGSGSEPDVWILSVPVQRR